MKRPKTPRLVSVGLATAVAIVGLTAFGASASEKSAGGDARSVPEMRVAKEVSATVHVVC